METQEHLDALIERVRSYSIGYPCPAIVELTVMDDPWGRARLYAGIGEDRGFVQELWNPPRATQGDPEATGVVVYDLQANDTEIPACQEVPLATVRSVLAAYLAHGGVIPEGFAELHLVN